MRAKTKILTISQDQSLVTLLQRELNDGNYEIVNTEHCDINILEPKDILAGDENLLAPIQQVKLEENIQN